MHRSKISLLILAMLAPFAVAAQNPAPFIKISVDASEAPRKIFHARLEIPCSPGTLTLYYPKWIPGEHAPDGPILDLTGLKFQANGSDLKWRRDLVDGFTFHVEIPPGVSRIEAQLDYLSPGQSGQTLFSAGSSATASLAVISWNQVLLYPRGWTSDELIYEASLRLPAGWKFGTSLRLASPNATTGTASAPIQFAPVSLTTLVDSPVLAGQYFKVVPLSKGKELPAELDIAADSEAALDAPPEVWDHYRNLITQATNLFGAHHYLDYHFLFTLSDHVAHFGLEHHESDDSRSPERSLIDYDSRSLNSSLLPHEYVHSWNGKYRRPAGLTTPNYQEPMQDDLLWVYEGLTEYLGDILTARSGLWAQDQYRDYLARVAADLDHTPGRSWRNLQDTADAAPQTYFTPDQMTSWRRGTDFYDEGELDWLWADAIIRNQTHGKKSIDDFCHLFHGPPNTPPMVKTYTFDDVIQALNQVAPYDWRGFWTERLTNHGLGAPLGGIEASGWKVSYDDTPSDMTRNRERIHHEIVASYSVGLLLDDDGTVIDVVSGMSAAKAGMGPTMKIVAVNNRKFSGTVFHDALAAAKQTPGPLELLVENTDYYRTFKLDYHEGEKYPHLVRDEAKPDLLTNIINPR
ncbi:MAG: M61 family metallopeptidase [Acidobacteriales bacterium]|nr:M61 family metallopeptidase [Terriglobales bacterium]